MFGEKLTSAQWHAACDAVRTALAIQNADVLDEQLAGFGEILQELCAAIRQHAEAVSAIAEAISDRDGSRPVNFDVAVPQGLKR
jgi:hypothetical protein